MKLLIVDDEELTRTGVISSIDWSALGITEVLQADDGIHGLEAARLHRPEIILCDVRMPRMDGISMLERLENILPDSVPIFMSGYSDKEYLKAAIKLKAVNYVEKPLDIREIRDAVREAAGLYQRRLRSRRGETLQSLETASQLALQLTVPYGSNSKSIEQLSGELSLKLNSGTCFADLIVRLGAASELPDPVRREIYQAFEDYLKSFHMNCLYTEKHTQYLVYAILGQTRPSPALLQAAGRFLCRQYEPYGRFAIVAGEVSCGIARAYQSFESAVILLKKSFFFPEDTFLTVSDLEKYPAAPASSPPDPENSFSAALLSRDKHTARDILNSLKNSCYRNPSLLQNPVKDLYYKLFLSLEDARRQLKVTADPSGGTIAETIENCFSFLELHEALESRCDGFFKDLESSVEENPTIFMIKEYIGKNYMSETLSVKDISSHVFLSASYVCTFFKNETGKTLNQYLTEYRMEQAKRLLEDPRYKISDISSRVGYSDGSYFGKSFKKYSGFSPSEYREKMMP